MQKLKNAFIVFILASLLTACNRPYTPSIIQLCRLDLLITIQQGLNAQTNIIGQVDFGSNASNNFRGFLVEQSGASHPITFSFDGQAIHFILELASGNIYGTGVMESGLYTCSGVGGGTQTGPSIGDLGDWRGEWISEEIPNPKPTPTPTSVFDEQVVSVSITCILLIVIVSFTFFLRIIKPSTRSTKPSTISMRRPSQKITSALGTKPPLVEYLATYIAGDELFDLSIDIERSGRYLGECGVGASNQLDKISGQATGFEIWLFDPASAETVSKNLLSEYCFRFESTINAGQAFLIRPHVPLQLETRNIKVMAEIKEIEYKSESLYPNSIIKKAVIKIEAWEKPDSTSL